MPAETKVRAVLTTAPDPETAATLARTLVNERLAACVNVVPGAQSFYRWQGRVAEDAEVLLIIKTQEGLTEALASRIKDLHPYDLPEVLVLAAVGGSATYLHWVESETTS
ncbi:MAG: divalent-cation tolerance protein CutA [Myxococcota bacterium]